jgi:hypothetical protein
MSRMKNTVGTTHQFVLVRGFGKIGRVDCLIGADGSKRLFAELFADPDHPDVRPREAYQAILASMQPGWTLRLLQVFWPESQPRMAFQDHAGDWRVPESDGLDILHQGLLLALEQFPLPFGRRTILEFVYPGDEGIAWWQGLGGLCQGFGVRFVYLEVSELQSILNWIFNPALD